MTPEEQNAPTIPVPPPEGEAEEGIPDTERTPDLEDILEEIREQVKRQRNCLYN